MITEKTKLTHEILLHLSSLSIVVTSFSSQCFGKNVILMDIILKLTDGIYKCLIDDNAVLVVLERISYPRALNNYASLMKVTNETKWEISKQINKNKRIQTV